MNIRIIQEENPLKELLSELRRSNSSIIGLKKSVFEQLLKSKEVEIVDDWEERNPDNTEVTLKIDGGTVKFRKLRAYYFVEDVNDNSETNDDDICFLI